MTFFETAFELLYVDERFDLRWRRDHYHNGSGHSADSIATFALSGYLGVNIKYMGKMRTLRAHSLVWWLYSGDSPYGVDHIDGDGTNNHIDNLRGCTRQQNLLNRGPTYRSKSGFKGVSFHKANGMWHANASICGNKRHLGFYKNRWEAAMAYDMFMINSVPDDLVTFCWLNYFKSSIPDIDDINNIRRQFEYGNI